MLRIRLRKAPKEAKKRTAFRISITDKKDARDGNFIEEIGYYNPAKTPPVLKVDLERAAYWISKGAKPTETVEKLLKKAKEAIPAAK